MVSYYHRLSRYAQSRVVCRITKKWREQHRSWARIKKLTNIRIEEVDASYVWRFFRIAAKSSVMFGCRVSFDESYSNKPFISRIKHSCQRWCSTEYPIVHSFEWAAGCVVLCGCQSVSKWLLRLIVALHCEPLIDTGQIQCRNELRKYTTGAAAQKIRPHWSSNALTKASKAVRQGSAHNSIEQLKYVQNDTL